MNARNFVVSQNKQLFFADNNFIISQKSNLEANKSFKDVMKELLGNGGIKTANSSGQEQKNDCMNLKSNVSEVSKSASRGSAETQKKIESAVKWLANYLGIKPSFLLAVFSKLGIDPNDMADQMKFVEIIQKLFEHFNLNEEQRKEIAEKMGGILGFNFG